jgi:uncharacterized protein YdeI (YjbR/CyaY-like superfamily)
VKPVFFAKPAEFRAWLEKNHDRAGALLVGFHKVGSGKPSMTWPESVDQALCFGWIDGVRKSLGATRYTIRFSPRQSGSIWSAINIRRAGELDKQGLMLPSGRKAFAARSAAKSAIYAHEQRKTAALGGEHERRLRAVKKAWDFFQAQAPWYWRATAWWVISAKQEATRLRRLATLIRCSAAGQAVPPLIQRKRKT